MKKIYAFVLFFLSTYVCVQAQSYKFYASNGVRIMKNKTDSLQNPFSGGFNSPQFSNIDLNGDGRLDLFVFDRSSNRVATFLNTTNGYIHSPAFDGRFPFLNNWALLSDYDADGRIDIMTETNADVRFLPNPDGNNPFAHGLRIFRNITPLNGQLTFKQINNQIFDTGGVWLGWNVPIAPSAVSMNNTDIPAFGDIDGDGDMDILSFTTTGLSPRFYENFKINKYNITYPVDSTRYILRDECWGHIQYDAASMINRFKLHQTMSQLSSCAFQMYGKRQKHAGTTLCMLDFNHDGVLDLIYGDTEFENLILLMNSKNSLGRDSIISQDTLFPSNTTQAKFIQFPAAYYVDITGDAKKELVITTNESIAAKSKDNVWYYNNTGTNDKPVFEYAGNNLWLYDETLDLGTRNAPTLVDIDGDGDEDLVIATSGDFAQTNNINDRLVLYINTPDPQTGRSVFTLQDTNFLNISANGGIIHAMPTFIDLNGDGKKDLILGIESGELLFYKNTSSGSSISFERQASALDVIDVGVFAAPTFADLDGDGDYDLVVGNRAGILKLYMNRGTTTEPLFDASPTIDSFGMVNTRFCINTTFGIEFCELAGMASPYFYDLNGDGTPELIVGSEAGYVYIYTGIDTMPGTRFTKFDSIFVDFSNGTNTTEKRHGRRAVPCVGKMDGDTLADIMIGNLAGGLSFFGSIPSGPFIGLNKSEAQNKFVSMYPNPASSKVVLLHQNLYHNATYSIMNIAGKLMASGTLNHMQSQTTIDISELQAGVYFLSIISNGNRQVQKLVIQK